MSKREQKRRQAEQDRLEYNLRVAQGELRFWLKGDLDDWENAEAVDVHRCKVQRCERELQEFLQGVAR